MLVNRKKVSLLIVCLCQVLMSTATFAGLNSQDAEPKKVLDEAERGIKIVGDQELPQVLYIIPWQPVTLPIKARTSVKPDMPAIINICLLMNNEDKKSLTNNNNILICEK